MTAPGAQRLDPITFEVLRLAFEDVTAQMGRTLQRTSRSPIIYDSVDFSNALFNERSELVGQTSNVPVHLAAMHFSVLAAIEELGGLEPGDVGLLNDPYAGGSHIPDMTFVAPLYSGDELLGYAASRGHWTDMGGGAPGGRVPSAVHVAQEGFRIPPVRIVRGGEPVEDIVKLIGANTRMPAYNLADVEAHRASLMTAERRVGALVRRYGIDTVRRAMEELLDYTERRTRAAIAALPDGTYRAEDFVDCDGVSTDSRWIRVELEVAGDEMTVDFRGTDPMTAGPINCPFAVTHSAVFWGLKFFLDPEAPANAGSYRPITVRIPDGCFIGARWPAPVYLGNLVTSERICDTLWQALEPALGERLPGLPYGDSNGTMLGITNAARGVSFVVIDLPPGGWGASRAGDGMSATYSRHGNCMDLDPEMAEVLYPLRIERRELLEDSGGPGEHRGGLAITEEFAAVDETLVLANSMGRTKVGPPGSSGGHAGRPGRCVKVDRDGRETVIGGTGPDGVWRMISVENVVIRPGERVRIEAQGGGGWGDPRRRDPERVHADVEDGYVTAQSAREVYGSGELSAPPPPSPSP
jgi:N-methylhydantoinase B